MDAAWTNHLEKIQNEIRRCAELPYLLKPDGNKRFFPLVSRCPNIELSEPVNGRSHHARIQTEDGVFSVELIETEMTDGDLYDVRIRDLASNDQIVLPGIFAYGDALLGALGGSLDGIRQDERL